MHENKETAIPCVTSENSGVALKYSASRFSTAPMLDRTDSLAE